MDHAIFGKGDGSMKHTIIIAGLAAIVLAGCNNSQPASTKPTQSQVDASVAATQKKITEVQNDPSIPAGVKDQIIGRLKGNMDRTIAANHAASTGQ